jgi:hypothetical protein
MLKILTIRDIKADVYGNPVFSTSIGGAIRSFGDEVLKTDGNPLSLHPADFELYHIGEFDPNTAEFNLIKPQRVALGSEYK